MTNIWISHVYLVFTQSPYLTVTNRLEFPKEKSNGIISDLLSSVPEVWGSLHTYVGVAMRTSFSWLNQSQCVSITKIGALKR